MRDTAKEECRDLETDWRGNRGDSSCINVVVATKVKVLTRNAFLISHRAIIFGLQHNVNDAPLSCAVDITCDICESFQQHSHPHPQLQTQQSVKPLPEASALSDSSQS